MRLQRFEEKGGGFTDIELTIDNDLFVILEAKRGWSLPGQSQLDKYGSRFEEQENKPYRKKLVVVSECRKEYAQDFLRKLKTEIVPDYLSWHEIYSLVRQAYEKSNASQKRILADFSRYFRKVISVRDKKSNQVYCLVLSAEKPKGWGISYIDIVEKKKNVFLSCWHRRLAKRPAQLYRF